MVSDMVVTCADIGQSIVPVIGLAAYIPQWRKLLRSRSSENFSMRAWLLWACSGTLTLFYAIVQLRLAGRGWPLVFSALVGLLFIMFTIVLLIKFRKPTRSAP
ncbi:MAG: PQ-loop repeat-containing protein [Verrucomicrobia bacterium]|nr:PQ-loop repeat-containing protein [Verrucomicrobiota bacterium]